MDHKSVMGLVKSMIHRGPLSKTENWRVHGLGMLQAYVPEREDLRIHIWAPELQDPRLVDHQIHDHRFDLISTVLTGAIINHAFDIEEDEEGPCRCYTVKHATLKEFDPPIEQKERYRIVSELKMEHSSGEFYQFSREFFHKTTALHNEHGVVITLVRRENFSRSPGRILSMSQPPHAFSIEEDHATKARILGRALDSL